MSANYVVYQSRNRITGTLCQTLDTRHSDCPPADRKAAGDNRYLARCLEHNVVAGFVQHYDAGRAIAHVDEWCPGCQAMMVQENGRVKMPPTLRNGVMKFTSDMPEAAAKPSPAMPRMRVLETPVATAALPTAKGADRKPSSQWAGQFLVAAELIRHGYEVSFTMGNSTPVADLMVGHPGTGNQFWVDVKTQRSNTGIWAITKSPRLNLFYIVVVLGPQVSEDRFFVLTHVEWNHLIEQYMASGVRKASGINWSQLLPFEGGWEKLPDWLL